MRVIIPSLIVISVSLFYISCEDEKEEDTTPPAVSAFNSTFGGSQSDEGNSVQQTSDGGFIIAGYTESYGNGNSDVWLIKTDQSGVKEWDYTFGGSNSDEGNSVQQTSDGGFIIAGNNGSDAWLIKTNSSGVEEWDNTFSGSYSAVGNSVQQTSDGGFIITGKDGPDVWLIKTYSSGVEEWNDIFGGDKYDEGNSVQQTVDGGYIITGSIRSYRYGNSDVWLIKTDQTGVKEWDYTFGGSQSDEGNSVQQTSDGGFIIAGYTRSYGNGYSDVWLIKTNSSGVEEWNHIFGGGLWDYGYSVQQTSDGGFIITGYTESYRDDVWLIKTDPLGNTSHY